MEMGNEMIPEEKKGEMALNKEGVVTPAEAQEAVAAAQMEMAEVEGKAEQLLQEVGGDLDTAIEEATLDNNTQVAEYLRVKKLKSELNG